MAANKKKIKVVEKLKVAIRKENNPKQKKKYKKIQKELWQNLTRW